MSVRRSRGSISFNGSIHSIADQMGDDEFLPASPFNPNRFNVRQVSRSPPKAKKNFDFVRMDSMNFCGGCMLDSANNSAPVDCSPILALPRNRKQKAEQSQFSSSAVPRACTSNAWDGDGSAPGLPSRGTLPYRNPAPTTTATSTLGGSSCQAAAAKSSDITASAPVKATTRATQEVANTRSLPVNGGQTLNETKRKPVVCGGDRVAVQPPQIPREPRNLSKAPAPVGAPPKSPFARPGRVQRPEASDSRGVSTEKEAAPSTLLLNGPLSQVGNMVRERRESAPVRVLPAHRGLVVPQTSAIGSARSNHSDRVSTLNQLKTQRSMSLDLRSTNVVPPPALSVALLKRSSGAPPPSLESTADYSMVPSNSNSTFFSVPNRYTGGDPAVETSSKMPSTTSDTKAAPRNGVTAKAAGTGLPQRSQIRVANGAIRSISKESKRTSLLDQSQGHSDSVRRPYYCVSEVDESLATLVRRPGDLHVSVQKQDNIDFSSRPANPTAASTPVRSSLSIPQKASRQLVVPKAYPTKLKTPASRETDSNKTFQLNRNRPILIPLLSANDSRGGSPSSNPYSVFESPMTPFRLSDTEEE